MSSRRVTALVVVLIVATGGLFWRSALGRGNSPDPAVVRALSSLTRDGGAAVAVLSEGPNIDGLVGAASFTIVPRDAGAIEAASRAGTVVAGPRGHEYLEALGYELRLLPQSADSGSFPIARIQKRLHCAGVKGDAWSPLPGLEYTGRLGVLLPPSQDGALSLVVGDDLPLDIDVTSLNDGHVRMQRELLPSVAAAPPDYWIEGRSPRDAPGVIQQLTLQAAPDRELLLSVRLGRRAPRTLARLHGFDTGARATVCAAPTGVDEAFTSSDAPQVIYPDMPWHFGSGWGDVLLIRDVGPVRWMGRHAALLLRLARRGDAQVSLRAYRQPDAGDGEVSLRINDMFDVAGQPLREGAQLYQWRVPASAWVAGTNEILVRVSGEGDQRLLAFARIELSLQAP